MEYWLLVINTSSLTAILISFVLWLSRNIILTRLTNGIKHEYDKKLEGLKTTLRNSEESLKADLRSKESQIESLRTGALSNVTNRHNTIFNRQLEAIDQLWNAIINLGSAKFASVLMSTFKFDVLAKAAAKNPEIGKVFATLDKYDLKNLSENNSIALTARPFVSPLAWAYFVAYQAIISDALLKLNIIKIGIDDPKIHDATNATNLIKVALPHRKEYIDKYGPSAYYNLIEELESKLLSEFQLIMEGKEFDKASVEQANAIVKASSVIMEKNSTEPSSAS